MGRTLGLDESSLKTHPMRHVLTMAVGVGSALRIRYYAVALDRDSIMMLSSDGLHGVVAEEELERILNESPAALQDKCLELIAAANAAGGPDNVTVVLIRRTSLIPTLRARLVTLPAALAAATPAGRRGEAECPFANSANNPAAGTDSCSASRFRATSPRTAIAVHA